MFPIFLFFNRHDDDEDDDDDGYEPDWYPEIPNWLYYSIIGIYWIIVIALLYWGYTVIHSSFL